MRIETLRALVAAIILLLIAGALWWSFGASVTGPVVTLGSLAIGYLLFYIYEFLRETWRIDRKMMPLILIVIGVVCLSAGTVWFIWNKHREVRELTQRLDAEKSRRANITNSVTRLLNLLQGKEEFEQAVSKANQTWSLIEGFKRGLAERGDIVGWVRLESSWQNSLNVIERIVDRTIGKEGSIFGHTTNYDPSAKIEGEGNMLEQHKQRWREAFNRHSYATTFITTAGQRLDAEIDGVKKGLLIAVTQRN